jgi:hypothetical protein
MTDAVQRPNWADIVGQAAYESYLRNIRSDPEPPPAWRELPDASRTLWRYVAADVLAVAPSTAELVETYHAEGHPHD